MRQTNVDLVKRVLKKEKHEGPIYDIGGAGFEFMWNFPTVTVDVNSHAHIVADCSDLSVIPNETAGTVITTDTFEHIKYPFKAIEEIHRILKHGGLLILSTVLTWGYHEFPGDYFRYTVEGLEALCERFEKIESGWSEENVPLANGHVIDPQAGVFYVGRKK